jgi:hypothetical protein
MRTLTGTFKLTIALLLAGLGLGLAGHSLAAKKKTCTQEWRFGVDANGCEKVEPLHADKKDVEKLLKASGIPKECYRVHFWNDHKPDVSGGTSAEQGGLDDLVCKSKEVKNKNGKVGPFQPSGVHVTQRIMYETLDAQKAFEEKLK